MAGREPPSGTITITVIDQRGRFISNATVQLYKDALLLVQKPNRPHNGRYVFQVEDGSYSVSCQALGFEPNDPSLECKHVEVKESENTDVEFNVPAFLEINIPTENLELHRPTVVKQPFVVRADFSNKEKNIKSYDWTTSPEVDVRRVYPGDHRYAEFTPVVASHKLSVTAHAHDGSQVTTERSFSFSETPPQRIDGKIGVTLFRSAALPSRGGSGANSFLARFGSTNFNPRCAEMTGNSQLSPLSLLRMEWSFYYLHQSPCYLLRYKTTPPQQIFFLVLSHTVRMIRQTAIHKMWFA